jgi:hypothetical protein
MKVIHHDWQDGLDGIDVQECKKTYDPNDGLGCLRAIAEKEKTNFGGRHGGILGFRWRHLLELNDYEASITVKA